ncbi:hypothetical protein A9196_20200 [Aeromonas dhakensis]|nr:hypothetical protein A9196_20200 [Aeromonas dhakensis]
MQIAQIKSSARCGLKHISEKGPRVEVELAQLAPQWPLALHPLLPAQQPRIFAHRIASFLLQTDHPLAKIRQLPAKVVTGHHGPFQRASLCFTASQHLLKQLIIVSPPLVVRVSQWARMPLVNQKPAGKEMGQRIIAEIAPKPLIIPRMLGLDIKGIVIRSWPDGVMTGEPVNQFEIFAAMADKLFIKSPQLQKPLTVYQQATAGQGNPLHPVIFTAQKRL